MKKILYDLTSAQSEKNIKYNGGGEYALRIFEFLLARNDVNLEITVSNFKETQIDLIELCNSNSIKIHSYSSNRELSEIINTGRFDTVVLPVCYSKYAELNINKNIRMITVIHDLSVIYADTVYNNERLIGQGNITIIKELLKKYIFHSSMLKKHINEHKKLCKLSNNQTIIFDSDYTRYAFEFYTKQFTEGIILYPAINDTIISDDSNINADFEKLGIYFDKFFLLVSGSRWHKNNYFAIKVLDNLFENNLLSRSYKVLVTGVNDEHRKFYENHVRCVENFVFIDYVKYNFLQELYKHTFALIYPSLFEGFGYPPIDAMKYSRPVIASNRTSIPEICQNACLFFDPVSAESLSIAILQLVNKGVENNCIENQYEIVCEKQKKDLNRMIELIVDENNLLEKRDKDD